MAQCLHKSRLSLALMLGHSSSFICEVHKQCFNSNVTFWKLGAGSSRIQNFMTSLETRYSLNHQNHGVFFMRLSMLSHSADHHRKLSVLCIHILDLKLA